MCMADEDPTIMPITPYYRSNCVTAQDVPIILPAGHSSDGGEDEAYSCRDRSIPAATLGAVRIAGFDLG
jgi:hypothetical protein